MFKFSYLPKNVRFISQFLLPRTDCKPILPQKKILDLKACGRKEHGLILGVYVNEKYGKDNFMLTKSAQKYNDKHGGKLAKLLKLTKIPRLGESRVFYDIDPNYLYVAVVGLGSECLTLNCTEKMDERAEAIRVAAAIGTKALYPNKPKSIDIESFGDAEAAAEGSNLANWEFNEFKSPDLVKFVRPTLDLYDSCDYDCWNIGKIKAEAQNLVRYLQELPANILNPTSFSKICVDMLCELDINVHVKTKGWANSYDMGGFVGIGKSSVQPPLYVELSYYGACPDKRPIVLIGKGVTFNSGSIDLKPRHELKLMKGDMAGAACVVALIRAAAILKLPLNLRGILPLCELMPNGSSPHFGDHVKCANGMAIRLRLPALQGRLLIADSLAYARNYWPKLIIDIGTMSKEVIDAFGSAPCPAYTNSEEIFAYLENASIYTGDRIWRMPLWQYYANRLKDTHTNDIANMARNIYGESPNCAAFLKQFVCDSQWLHLDTYNVMYTKGDDVPYLGRGMTGRPTRTIIEMFFQMLSDGKL